MEETIEKTESMSIHDARNWAAQAWCDERNEKKEMDIDLAMSFAEILQQRVTEAIGGEKIKEARKCFRNAFADRAPGSFHHAYVCNVAMLLHDRYGITDCEARNKAANDILDLIFF